MTLNSQRATQVTVLPDMKGIIAYFDTVLPAVTDAGREENGLHIWTTQGGTKRSMCRSKLCRVIAVV